MGLIKYISEWEKDNLWGDIRLVIGQSITLSLLISVFFIVISVFLADEISYLLCGDEQYSLLVIFISIAIPFALVNSIFEAFIRGLKRFGHYVLISVTFSFFSLAVTIVSVYYLQITGALLSLSISALIGLIIYIIYFHKTQLLKLSQFISTDFRYSDKFRLIIKLGIAALLIGITDQFTQIIVRTIIIRNLEINANGLYQSVYSISLNYFSILFMSIGIYLLPVLSELKNKELINMEINTTLRFTFMLIIPLLSSLFIFRKYIILLLYSKEFLPSTELLYFNFLGDYFKAFSWVIGAWLVPSGRIKEWVFFSLIYYFSFIFIFVILLYFFNLGLKSVVISYFISYLIFSLINLYFITKYNEFKFSKINLKLLPLSILFLIIILSVANYNPNYGFILFIPVMILWFKFIITTKELTQSYELVKTKILAFKTNNLI